jgi:hypothetical protein
MTPNRQSEKRQGRIGVQQGGRDEPKRCRRKMRILAGRRLCLSKDLVAGRFPPNVHPEQAEG